MKESTARILERLIEILHWLGKYAEANDLTVLLVLMREMGTDEADKFSEKVMQLREGKI